MAALYFAWSVSLRKGVADCCLFSVDDGFVNGIPTGCGDTPVVGGVLVAIDSDLASFYFFVGIDTHDSVIFLLFNFLIDCSQQVYACSEKDCAKLRTYFDIHNFFVDEGMIFSKIVAIPIFILIFAI